MMFFLYSKLLDYFEIAIILDENTLLLSMNLDHMFEAVYKIHL